MGLWAGRVLPLLVDRALRGQGVAPLRAEACAGLAGDVVELGFGSGLNVPYYPPSVDRVLAVEPQDGAWRLAARRVDDSPVPVLRGGLDGQRLDQPSESADAFLSTFSLCVIPDLAAALAEVRRVLRPGGTIHFLEHGLAPEPEVRRWQRRLEPLQRAVAGGCHLTREFDRLLEDAGFALDRCTKAYVPEAVPSRVAGFLYRGVATRPG